MIDSSDGKVCGHVLASRTGQTYICPMDLLLEDIKQTLGAKEVVLPAVTEVEVEKSRPGSSSSSSERKAMLADAINRMRIGEAEAGGVPIPPSSPVRAREVQCT